MRKKIAIVLAAALTFNSFGAFADELAIDDIAIEDSFEDAEEFAEEEEVVEEEDSEAEEVAAEESDEIAEVAAADSLDEIALDDDFIIDMEDEEVEEAAEENAAAPTVTKATIVVEDANGNVYDALTTTVEDGASLKAFFGTENGVKVKANDTVTITGDLVETVDLTTEVENILAAGGTLKLDLSGLTYGTDGKVIITALTNETVTTGQNADRNSGKLCVVNQGTGINLYAAMLYTQAHAHLSMPGEYVADSALSYGVRVSYVMDNEFVVPARIQEADGYSLAKNTSVIYSPTDVSYSPRVVGTVTLDASNVPTCEKGGSVKIDVEITGIQIGESVKYCGTKDNVYFSDSVEFTSIAALGHKYGQDKNGLVTLPKYDTSENAPKDAGENPLGKDYGVYIDWATRGTNGSLIVSADSATGYPKINSVTAMCLNTTAHGTGTKAPKWTNVASYSITNVEEGTKATATTGGTHIYTLAITTADGVELTVRQTVEDVPATAATTIGEITNLQFAAYEYTASNGKLKKASDNVVWLKEIVAWYTKGEALAHVENSGTNTVVATGKYYMSAFDSEGNLEYKLTFYDAQTSPNTIISNDTTKYTESIDGNTVQKNRVAGTKTGTMSPVDVDSTHKSSIVECGMNTYYYAPLKFSWVSNFVDGSVNAVTIGQEAEIAASAASLPWVTSAKLPAGYTGWKSEENGADRYASYKNAAGTNYFAVAVPSTDADGFSDTVAKAAIVSAHTLDMYVDRYEVTTPATAFSTGEATITCKYCGRTIQGVEVPASTTGVRYEVKDGAPAAVATANLAIKADDVATAKSYGTWVVEADCEVDGYSYYWSADATKKVSEATAISADNIKNAYAISGEENVAFGYNTKTDKWVMLKKSDGKWVEGTTDTDGYTIDNFVGKDGTVHKYFGVAIKVEGSETKATGHDFYLAKQGDVKWYNSEGELATDTFTEATGYAEIEYTCEHNKNHTKTIKYYFGKNTEDVKEDAFYGGEATNSKPGVLYSAISKETIKGADCTKNNKIVYTVDKVVDVRNYPVVFEMVDTAHFGDHNFKDTITWAPDGKSATVSRTCLTKDCSAGYDEEPLIVTPTITKATNEDGSYTYTAKYGSEELGTKTVFDLNDAVIVINDGEKVDENIYDTDKKMAQIITVTLNGVEVDKSLYTLTTGSKKDSLTLYEATVSANSEDGLAIGTASEEYDVYHNYTYVFWGDEKVVKTEATNDTPATYSDAEYYPELELDGEAYNSEDIEYTGTAHVVTLAKVYGRRTTAIDPKAYRFDEVNLKKTDVLYAAVKNNVAKDPSKLEYAESLSLSDAGSYAIYIRLSGDNYTTEAGLAGFVYIEKADLMNYAPEASSKTIVYGDTSFKFTTGNADIDEMIGIGTKKDVSKLSVGKYNLSTLYTDNGNYNVDMSWINDDNAVLEIKPRSAKVVLQGGTVDYTGVEIDPQTLYSADGAVNGDDLNVIVNTVGNRKLLEPGTYELVATANNANYTVDEVKATLTIKASTADAAAAQDVIDKINALNDNSTAAQVSAARKAYEALTDAQKAIVSADTLKKLEDAETKVAQNANAVADAKKNAEDKAAAAKTAADKAKADPTDANVKAAETAVAAANTAIANAKKAGADTKTAESTLASANTALTAAKKANEAAKNIKITLGNKKVTKKLNAKGTATKRITIKKGKKLSLKAKASDGSKITYKSNKKKVATVSKKGVIKAKKKGSATITVKAGSKTVKVKIKVK